MEGIDYLLVVGGSGSGKDTLLKSLRETPEFEGKLDLPVRYSTRTEREGDRHSGYEYRPPEAFEEGVALNLIRPHWSRPLDIGSPLDGGPRKKERYGFSNNPEEQNEPGQGPLRVFFVDPNFLDLSQSNDTTDFVIARAFLVILSVTREIREQRLRVSSPGMTKGELAARLREGDSINTRGAPGTLIPTGDIPKEVAQSHLHLLVDRILQDRYS